MLTKQLQGAALATQPVFVEEVFQSWLYTGNGSTQTITNGVDLSTYGGMVWTKSRSAVQVGRIYDSARGTNKNLIPSLTDAQGTDSPSAMNFSSSGFGLVADNSNNQSGTTYASWTFRKQAKFFDVVTYTGNGVNNRKISHSLGSTPGCMIIKRTSGTEAGGIAGYWIVYHRGISTPQSNCLFLNTTDSVNGTSVWNNTAPTSTEFTLGTSYVNYSGDTYVAYLFAHDAGGFGLTGTDNVISCGSYTGNSSSQSINIGYEPQWILVKNITNVSDWQIIDVMRGMSYTSFSPLYANLSNAEITGTSYRFEPTATGWNFPNAGAATYNTTGNTYIYIAIRRGPMRTPTSGTSVFIPVTYAGNGSTTTGQLVSAGFTVDMGINRYNRAGTGDWDVVDRLRGLTSIGVTPASRYLNPNKTNAEASGGYIFDATNTSVDNYGFSASFTQSNYLFRRAPGFFDVVCYTGTGGGQTVTHNLGVAPELVIFKCRSNAATGWPVRYGNSTDILYLNTTDAVTGPLFNGGNNTSTYITTRSASNGELNQSGSTYVAYLFATVAGVSKVGSYQGNGTSKTIDCGFTAGARFVMIKRTDSTGDWKVIDTARGIVSGNDPTLALNSTAAEVTGTDCIDPDNSGFIVNQETTNNLNVNNATYIFLAIA